MKRKLKEIIKKNKLLHSFFWNLLNYSDFKQNKATEKLLSNVTEGQLVISLTNIPGEFEMDIRSHILRRALISKEYEPNIVSCILNNLKPGMDAVNIGANVGLFTNLIAGRINSPHKVLAVEPAPNAFDLLKKNLVRNNNLEKAILFKGIAADKHEIRSFNIIQGNEEYSSLGSLVHESVKEKDFVTREVQGTTIDLLVSENKLKPGLLVIDAEGSEWGVLKGAEETLKNYHPVIISELDDVLLKEQDSSARQVIEFLEKFNYKIMTPENKKIYFPFQGNIIAKYNYGELS